MIYNKIFYSKKFYFWVFLVLFFLVVFFIGFISYKNFDVKKRENLSFVLYKASKSENRDEKIKILENIISKKKEPYYSIAIFQLINFRVESNSDLEKIQEWYTLIKNSSVESFKDLATLNLSILNSRFGDDSKIYYFTNQFFSALPNTQKDIGKSQEILNNINSATDSNQYIKELAKQAIIAYN